MTIFGCFQSILGLFLIANRMIITVIMEHSSRGDRIHRISFRLGTPVPRTCVSRWALEAWLGSENAISSNLVEIGLKYECNQCYH